MRKPLVRTGFTLVELLVVIAIIGVLVALLLPAVQAAREAARRSQCQNNLKQMGLAVQMHQDVHKRFPMGRNRFDQYAVSWAYYLLPYLEEKSAHDAYEKGARVDDVKNSHTMRTPLSMYACPSRRPAAADRNFDNNDSPPQVLAAASLGDYAANSGHVWHSGMTAPGEFEFSGYTPTKVGPIFTGSRIGTRHITDGLSHTLAIGERHLPPAPPGTSPEMEHHEQGDVAFIAGDNAYTIFAEAEGGIANGPNDPGRARFGSSHSGITQFLFLDGHVEPLSNNTSTAELMALSTIGGGETVTHGQ